MMTTAAAAAAAAACASLGLFRAAARQVPEAKVIARGLLVECRWAPFHSQKVLRKCGIS